MLEPTVLSQEMLKKMARYLAGKPRLVYRYIWQDHPADGLLVSCDTDFAGCTNTRRSTSSGVAMYGTHCLKHWASTQSTIALSSGEAELGGLCKGASMATGLRSVADDLGVAYDLTVKTDATAAMVWRAEAASAKSDTSMFHICGYRRG